MKHDLHITEGGERLDKYLHGQFPVLSRSWIQKLIKAGRVQINGKAVPPHRALAAGDRLTADLSQPEPIDLAPDPSVGFDVIEEAADFAVIRKPAGLVVHPSEGVRSHTLVNGLLARYPQMARVGDHPWRPGIVHRLDREAAGLMVVALTQTGFDHLKEQFKERQVEKTYAALALGRIAADQGEITFPIGRSEHGRMICLPKGSTEGRSARTEYEVRERFYHHTLVDAATKTGRTHQIRVHFHGIGHPLAGDRIYRISRFRAIPELPELFLFARRLAFTDQTGRKREYELPLPESWSQTLQELRKQ